MNRIFKFPSFLKLTFAQQLVLLALLPATLATLGAIAILQRQNLSNVTRSINANAQTVAMQVAMNALPQIQRMDRRALQLTALMGSRQPYVQRVQIITDDGEILATASTQEGRSGEHLEVSTPIAGDASPSLGYVAVRISMDALASARRAAWVTVALIIGVILVSVGLASWWSARLISAPIRALGQALDRLGAGQEVHLAVQGTIEAQHLQRGINQAARDLSESRKLLESRIADATSELEVKNEQLQLAIEAKTRLFTAASHDLRQPLYALMLFSESLIKGEIDPERQRRIGNIRECAESLNRLFTELLDLSRLDSGLLKPHITDFSLDTLFDEIDLNFRELTAQKNLRLIVRRTDFWVRGDYVMLLRILNNLMTNALRHTNVGGILVGARKRANNVRIDVWDTGEGIASVHHAKVFEEFYRVAPEGEQQSRGLGLGLATVQRLASLMGTRVCLSSRPGKGTCMSLMIELAKAPIGSVPEAERIDQSSADDCALGNIRILVIDDDRIIAEGLTVLLQGWGAQVMTAHSLAQALSIADQWIEPPDVILSDLTLQNGETGLEALAALEHHPNGIAATCARLIITGETAPERLKAVVDSGIKALTKEIAPKVLLGAIVDQLECVRNAQSVYVSSDVI